MMRRENIIFGLQTHDSLTGQTGVFLLLIPEQVKHTEWVDRIPVRFLRVLDPEMGTSDTSDWFFFLLLWFVFCFESESIGFKDEHSSEGSTFAQIHRSLFLLQKQVEKKKIRSISPLVDRQKTSLTDLILSGNGSTCWNQQFADVTQFSFTGQVTEWNKQKQQQNQEQSYYIRTEECVEQDLQRRIFLVVVCINFNSFHVQQQSNHIHMTAWCCTM